MSVTITEALAEIKTIGKRIDKKQESILQFLVRPDVIRDPLAKEEGGSSAFVARERQAISDLEQRLVVLRLAIQAANTTTPVTVEGVTKTLAEWLVWRREIAKGRQGRLMQLRQSIHANRQQIHKALAQQRGVAVVTEPKSEDIIVNVDEAQLAKDSEAIETVLAQLDGQLSLKNATVLVTV